MKKIIVKITMICIAFNVHAQSNYDTLYNNVISHFQEVGDN